MYRRILKYAVVILLCIGVYFSTKPFSSSLAPAAGKIPTYVDIELDNLTIGEPIFYEINQVPIIALKPNNFQLSLMQGTASIPARSFIAETGVYLYIGVSKGLSYFCELKHVPKPHPMRENKLWSGGYFSSACEISYDYSGKAIKTEAESYNGFYGDLEDLLVPKYKVINSSTIRVFEPKLTNASTGTL